MSLSDKLKAQGLTLGKNNSGSRSQVEIVKGNYASIQNRELINAVYDELRPIVQRSAQTLYENICDALNTDDDIFWLSLLSQAVSGALSYQLQALDKHPTPEGINNTETTIQAYALALESQEICIVSDIDIAWNDTRRIEKGSIKLGVHSLIGD